jgi:colanic acid biosynthesis glycosyl transferase WcaI
MEIFVLGINYYPEPIGISVYTAEMCEYLKDAGHKVTVFTGFPYYPQWKIERQYRKKFFMSEGYHGIEIKRSYLYVPHKITTKTRILHEFSFVISSSLNLLFSKRPETIIVISPPLLLGISAFVISKLKKVPFIFHVQDLQPDAAVKLGMVKKGKLTKLLYRIEKYIYKKASLVSVVSAGMRDRIISKGVPQEKVILFPNWVDTDFIKPLPKQNRFRRMYGIDNKFVVLYAGNIGVKQGLEIIPDVANLLQGFKDILFLVVGDGARKSALVKRAVDLNLVNVKFLPVQPREFLPEMLSAADISLVIQQAAVTDFMVPSKLLAILASGRPVIVSSHEKSELPKVVEQANCALIVKPEESGQLRDAILELYRDTKKRKSFGNNGREYARKYFSKEIILPKFQEELQHIINES